MDPSDQSQRGPSRRAFLRGAALGAAAGGLLGPGVLSPEAEAAEGAGSRVSGPTTARLKVNGRVLDVRVEPRTTLLDALRDGQLMNGHPVDLTGTKRVCDRGTCGACTVHLDGKPVYACSILALDAVGHDIRTVEGLGTPDKLSVLQQEFVQHDALMCGFCTPGMVMAAAALLADNRNPTRDQIRAALDGNVCRCGTYPRIFEAVEAAAARLRQGGA